MQTLTVDDTLELLRLYEEKRDVVAAVDVFIERHPESISKRHSLSGYLTWYRRRLSMSQKESPNSATHNFQFIHTTLVRSVKEILEKEGYRTVAIGNSLGRIPDIIALKEGCLYQVEIQRTDQAYNEKIDPQYDATIFFSGNLEPKLFRTIAKEPGK